MTWLDLRGGLGDTLIFSGVLKAAFDLRGERFDIVKRHRRQEFFIGHPAVSVYGVPKPGADVRSAMYVDDAVHLEKQRPFQVFARMLGLPTPIEEVFYLPPRAFDDRPLLKVLPRNVPLVVVCPGSSAPHKEMSVEKWEAIIRILNDNGICAVQLGDSKAKYIRGAYDFRGLTSPAEGAIILRNFHAAVGVDSFLLHAAYMQKIPTVALWGPTDPAIIGYDTHRNLVSKKPRCAECPTVLIKSYIETMHVTGEKRRVVVGSSVQCPLKKEDRCMDSFDIHEVAEAVLEAARRGGARSG